MRLSYIQYGLLLLLLAAVQLALFIIFIEIIVDRKLIFGVIEWGGLLTPSLGNVLLLFLLDALVVVSGIPILAKILYPQTGQDIKHSIAGHHSQAFWTGVLSGLSLFVYGILSYVALGLIQGLAIAVFLMYPMVTTLVCWRWWGDRPTPVRLAAMTIVAIGSLLVVPLPNFFIRPIHQIVLGMSAAGGSAIAFTSYLVLTRRGTTILHPLPFSAIAFGSVFVASCLSLMLPLEQIHINVDPDRVPLLMVGSIIIGVLTLVGYLLNNYGILLAGATRAAIVTASIPALTMLLEFILLQQPLDVKQILAMLSVMFGLVTLIGESVTNGDSVE